MLTILWLAAAIVTQHCDVLDVGNEAGGLTRSQGVKQSKNEELTKLKAERCPLFSIAQYNFTDITETSVGEITRPKEEQNERNQTLELPFNHSFPFYGKKPAEQIFHDGESNSRSKRQLYRNYVYTNSSWKDGIFYMFNTSDSLVQKLFRMGTRVWSENTCINFVENQTARDKVVVVKEAECWSAVGQHGGDQLLSIGGSEINEWSAVHEIGHVLGLLHTMQRYDRNNFITVFMQNVLPNHFSEFMVFTRADAAVFGLSYDYGSAMHYSDMAFTSNNRRTMVATDFRYQKTMGSHIISFSDIFMVNEHHGCNAKCNKSTSARCANEGFPHPRNCSKCICPGGYGGDLCDQRPPGCGETLEATRRKKSLAHTIGYGQHLRDKFNFCNFMIEAREGTKIEVNVQSISPGYDFSGCPHGGVEIKAQNDQKLTGYRFCSTNGTDGPIATNSSRLPLIVFDKLGKMKIKLTYRSFD